MPDRSEQKPRARPGRHRRRSLPTEPTERWRALVLGLRQLRTDATNLIRELSKLADAPNELGALAKALGSLKGDVYPQALMKAVEVYATERTFELQDVALSQWLARTAWKAVHGAFSPSETVAEAKRNRVLYGELRPNFTSGAGTTVEDEVEKALQKRKNTSDILRAKRVYNVIARNSTASVQPDKNNGLRNALGKLLLDLQPKR